MVKIKSFSTNNGNTNYKTAPSNLKMIYGKNLDGYTYIGSLEYDG